MICVDLQGSVERARRQAMLQRGLHYETGQKRFLSDDEFRGLGAVLNEMEAEGLCRPTRRRRFGC